MHWYHGVEVNYVSGRKAVLYVYDDEKEVEQVVLSDYEERGKEAMHEMMLEKGFVKRTEEEMREATTGFRGKNTKPAVKIAAATTSSDKEKIKVTGVRGATSATFMGRKGAEEGTNGIGTEVPNGGSTARRGKETDASVSREKYNSVLLLVGIFAFLFGLSRKCSILRILCTPITRSLGKESAHSK